MMLDDLQDTFGMIGQKAEELKKILEERENGKDQSAYQIQAR